MFVKVLVDIDDVVFRTREVVEKLINDNLERFGLSEPVSLYPCMNWENPVQFGVASERADEAFRLLCKLFYEAIKNPFEMIKDSEWAIAKLKEEGMLGGFLSSRSSEYDGLTRAQLVSVLGKDAMNDVEIFYKEDGHSKAEYLKMHGATILIDNQREHINAVSEAGYVGILFESGEFPNWPSVIDYLMEECLP